MPAEGEHYVATNVSVILEKNILCVGPAGTQIVLYTFSGAILKAILSSFILLEDTFCRAALPMNGRGKQDRGRISWLCLP